MAGFGGMRDHDGALSFRPRLPGQLTRIAFGLLVGGRRLRVELAGQSATYLLVSGQELSVSHYSERLELRQAEPQTRDVPAPPADLVAPTQPPGRAPARRGAPDGH